MRRIQQTKAFGKWLEGLRDQRARAKIASRIDRLRVGNAGDVRPIGGGLSELRIDHGPGYRVYFVSRGDTLTILLAGGTKQTQPADIARAHAIAEQIKGKE